MNTRQAFKIRCYPLPADPALKPSICSPYSDAQISEAGRVHMRALRRGDPDGYIKWAPTGREKTTRP